MPLQTQLIHSSSEPVFNILGPLTQFLVDPANASGAFGVLRSIVPPGVIIPLHSHADPEVLLILEGALEFLQYDGNSSRWLTAQPSQIICIAGGVKHALRNSSSKPTTVLLTTAPNLYGFFRQLGKPVERGQSPAPPTAEDLQRLAALSAQHNYWLASREENAAIGLTDL